jgi:ribosome-binding factor A
VLLAADGVSRAEQLTSGGEPVTQRTDRVDELLRQEIGDLIAREIADPAVGFATVTDVETSPDLRHARVWVSVIGQPEAREASVQALQRAMPFVRAQLGRRLRLKRIPEFSVRLDESVERGARVLQLLNELEAGASPDDIEVGESLPTPSRGFAAEPSEAADGAALAAGPPSAKPRRRRGSGGKTAATGRHGGHKSTTRRHPKR